MLPANGTDLPDSNSSNLVLRHPTPAECVTIWTNTSASWGDSLPLPVYLEESQYLTTVPLAKDGGMTSWILVDEHLAPGKRPILCSCESFWKHALISDVESRVKEGVVHGVASVFCEERYRGRGYANRMMRELSRELFRWQTEKEGIPVLGSILYSDIGKEYYARLGWQPNGTNTHIELRQNATSWPASAEPISATDLDELCRRDEMMIRSAMRRPSPEQKTRTTIIPNVEHMQWHIAKEDFACKYLFGKVPAAKGAIAGEPGNQVWALWTHRYYTHPKSSPKLTGNVLYILRLVMETTETTKQAPTAQLRPSDEQIAERLEHLKAVLQAAQAEAAEWKLEVIKMWNPTPLVHDLLADIGLQYEVVERQDENIASLLWYNEAGGISTEVPVWINNEHYAWC